jgi:hypothetical protein
MAESSTCRVCGDQLFKVVVAVSTTDLDAGNFEWQDENGDVLCPAKDWDDGAGPYHEARDST